MFGEALTLAQFHGAHLAPLRSQRVRPAEIYLLGNRVLLADVPTQAAPMPPSRLIGQVHRPAERADLRVVLVLAGMSPNSTPGSSSLVWTSLCLVASCLLRASS